MSIHRSLLISVGATVYLALAACTMPHLMGLGSYYQVTEVADGKVYYTEKFVREKHGVVEFQDAITGNRVSLPAADVKQITEAEYHAGTGQ